MQGKTINFVQRGAHEIAKDFGSVPADHEVRIKKRNGSLVLYTRPRATGVQRILQNLFADRAQKRSNAYQTINRHLAQHWQRNICEAALQKARGRESNADDYKRVFETISKASWEGLAESAKITEWPNLPEPVQKDVWQKTSEALRMKLWEVSPAKLQKELWKVEWLGLSTQEQKESWNEVPKEVQTELWQDFPQQLREELQKELPKNLPKKLSDFLEADFGPSVVAALYAAATKRHIQDDLKIILELHGMKDMEPDSARGLAAKVIAGLPFNEYNVPADIANSIAQRVGVNLKETMEVTAEALRKKMSDKSVNELVEILKPFLDQMVGDLHRNLYSDWRPDVH